MGRVFVNGIEEEMSGQTHQPRRGGVAAANYVLHIRRDDRLTKCGRVAELVNCATPPFDIDESICKTCAGYGV